MTRTSEARAPVRGGPLSVLLALSVANGLGYLLTLVASRRLGPSGFGALAALLGLVLVGNVLALGVQAVVARRVVANGLAGAVSWAARLALFGGCALAAAALTLSPLITSLLHLSTAWPAVALALTLVPLTVIGGQLGLMQGAERFHVLAVLYLVAGVGKVGGGVLGVVVGESVTATMVGTAVGSLAAAAAGLLIVRRALPSPGRTPLPRGLVAETALATYSLGGLFALTNVDVVLARHFLPPREAGLYAVGAVVAKGAFWLPSVVPVVAMPGLSDPDRRRRTAVAATAGVALVGLAVTLVVAFGGRLVARAVGGSAYLAMADRLWLFAALGSLFAMAQLLLYSRLAAEDRRAAAPVWALVVAEVMVVVLWFHASVTQIVLVALAAAVTLVGMGALAEVEEHRAGTARRRRG